MVHLFNALIILLVVGAAAIATNPPAGQDRKSVTATALGEHREYPKGKLFPVRSFQGNARIQNNLLD